ncbi:MAG TPA: acyl-CoA dehydrogenase family protein [Candidatus Limnocylindrales bacterium]|nr:acyl-CoA dehydrogenase family protein [Candidatus Limnocylindrales bacterium]
MTPEAKILLGSIRDLAPSISARSTEIDVARRLPRDLLAQLTAAGCFRMFVPKSHGGLDIDVPASMEIIETIATADGSTGWVVMIGSETPMLLALLSRKHFDSLYASTPDVIIAGAFAPRGQAELVDGNYRVSGRWSFASGCQHSQFLFGNCIVTENGTPRAGVIPGTAQARAMMFASAKAQILDTWSVNGLRGTGSHDIAVENLTVPADDTFDIFFGHSSIETPSMAEPLLYAALHIGTVAIGIAQRAINEIVALANTNKRRLYASASLAESPLFQYRVGNADASLRAARNLLRNQADTVWNSAVAGIPVSIDGRAPVMAAITWAVHTCAAVVDTCYKAGGGTSPYDSSPLQRCMRDIQTLTQHAAVAESWLTTSGATILGRPTGFAV